MNGQNWYGKVRLLFTLLLLVMIAGAVWTGGREAWFLAYARHAPGTVVSVRTSFPPGRKSGYYKYRPTIAFRDAAEKSWTFDSGRFGSVGRKVGVVLPVVYDPDNPAAAQIESFWGKWDTTFTFAYVGVFSLLLRWLFGLAAPSAKAAPSSGPTTPARL